MGSEKNGIAAASDAGTVGTVSTSKLSGHTVLTLTKPSGKQTELLLPRISQSASEEMRTWAQSSLDFDPPQSPRCWD